MFPDSLKAFFGWPGCDSREPEPFLGWQHLLFVTIVLAFVITLAVLLGRRNRNDERRKRKTLLKAAILMVSCELLKIVLISVRNHDPMNFLSMLPLFLCSLSLFTIPIAAFSKGRLGEIAADFTLCFGPAITIGGTYLASNYFGNSPIISFDLLISVTTHSISCFAMVYLLTTGMAKMEKRNIKFNVCFLFVFEGLALLADILLRNTNYENNYMFLVRSAGTPFEICNTIVGGNQILYTIFIALLYFAYLGLFILIFSLIKKAGKKRKNA